MREKIHLHIYVIIDPPQVLIFLRHNDISELALRKIFVDPACGHRVVIKALTLNLNLEHSVTYCSMLRISKGQNDINIEMNLIKKFQMLT
jgi:hypothetical protein